MLGRTTFGKGSVQTLIPLANKNYLKMTTARWYTPSGRSIQRPYGIGLAHEDGEEVADTSAAANDTTKKPAFKTDGGRTVYGGGGIHPDLVVNPDTLTLKEKAFFAKAGAKKAKDGKDRIIYNTETGETWLDKDGVGGKKAKLFAILDGSPDALSHNDFVVVA